MENQIIIQSVLMIKRINLNLFKISVLKKKFKKIISLKVKNSQNCLPKINIFEKKTLIDDRLKQKNLETYSEKFNFIPFYDKLINNDSLVEFFIEENKLKFKVKNNR